jgi:hypothetical protein
MRSLGSLMGALRGHWWGAASDLLVGVLVFTLETAGQEWRKQLFALSHKQRRFHVTWTVWISTFVFVWYHWASNSSVVSYWRFER